MSSICAKDSQHQKASINTLYDGASDHPAVYGSRRTEDGPWWWMKQAAFISGKPHVRCIVADTTIAKGDEVLRSELVCALKLMYHQMKCSRYAGSVVPVRPCFPKYGKRYGERKKEGNKKSLC